MLAPTDLVAVVASRAIPSIVTVQNLDEEFGQAGSGSGLVIRSNGFIVTNHHVIDGTDTLRVIMSEGLFYPAELVGTDPLMDIAVLRVEAGDLPYPNMAGVLRFGWSGGVWGWGVSTTWAVHTLVRRYLPGWEINAGRIEMFRPNRFAVVRYRYRGTKIPTPWESTTTTAA